MTDERLNRTPGLEQQIGEFTANPRVRHAAGIAFKAYLVWGAFVLLLVLVVLGFIGYEFLHFGN